MQMQMQVYCLPTYAVEVPQHSAGQAGQRQQDRNVSKYKYIHLVIVANKIKCLTSFVIFRLLALCDEFIPADPPEYFFDRNPDNFAVIHYYQSSIL